MANRTAEIIIGALFLVIAVGFGFYAMGSSNTGMSSDRYVLTASFSSAEGIKAGSDVRLAGVPIGKVTKIALDATTLRGVTTLAIDNDVSLPSDSTAIISSEGLMGGYFVEIIPGGLFINLPPGSEITQTQSAVSLITLLARMGAGIKQK